MAEGRKLDEILETALRRLVDEVRETVIPKLERAVKQHQQDHPSRLEA